MVVVVVGCCCLGCGGCGGVASVFVVCGFGHCFCGACALCHCRVVTGKVVVVMPTLAIVPAKMSSEILWPATKHKPFGEGAHLSGLNDPGHGQPLTEVDLARASKQQDVAQPINQFSCSNIFCH